MAILSFMARYLAQVLVLGVLCVRKSQPPIPLIGLPDST
jgi:hypothetical protein